MVTFSKLEPENLGESDLSHSDGEAPTLPSPLPLPELEAPPWAQDPVPLFSVLLVLSHR